MNGLILVTVDMAACNGFGVRPFNQWPNLAPKFDINQLEQQATNLPESERITFVDGEETEVDALTKKYGLTELNSFLNEVFDGYLHESIGV